MKLLNVIAQPEVAAAGQNESSSARCDRMRDFWARPENAVLHRVGLFLAGRVPDGRTLAEVVAGGEPVEMETIQVDGNTLPLAADTVLGLATVAAWGCPACRSAHGSGVYPSRAVSATKLATNKFYYRPFDQRLITISDTCWKKYVQELGADTPARFAAVTPQAFAPANGSGTSSSDAIMDALADKGNADENSASLAEQTDAVDSLNKRMGTFDDSDLWNNLNYFYPMFHNLVSTVAKDAGMSIGHVQRVLDGDRKSAKIQAAIVREFRRRIQTNDGREDRSNEAVPRRIRSPDQAGENAQVKLQNVTVPKFCNDGVGSDQNEKQIDRKKADETPPDASKNSKLYRFARWLRRA
ncbi:MAG: hypothetical protein ACKV2U_34080 [Bryobacteraceae bacterium]